MNKIIIRVGLLVFALAVFYYSQNGYALEEIFIKSFFMSAAVTIMLSVIILIVIRTINKGSYNDSE